MAAQGAFRPFSAFRSIILRLCTVLTVWSIRPSESINKDIILTVPIYGNIYEYAYYFIDIYVGSSSPPQKQSVILDSGSSLLAFPCSFCEHCGTHLDPPFNMDISPSAQFVACDGQCPCESSTNRCRYQVEYEEGSSIQGYYIRDFVRLGKDLDKTPSKTRGFSTDAAENSTTTSALPGLGLLTQDTLRRTLSQVRGLSWSGLVSAATQTESGLATAYFGCHSRETHQFLSQQASGVMGISFRSNDEEQTVMNSIFDAHGVRRRMFSVCLAHFGGLLSIGGAAVALPSTVDASRHPSSDDDTDAMSPEDSQENDHVNNSTLPLTDTVVFTPMIGRETYAISLKSITMDGQIIAAGHEMLNKGLAMLDTGTTYTLLPSVVLNRVLVLLEECRNQSSRCAGTWAHGKRPVTDPALEERCWIMSDYLDIGTFPDIKILTATGEVTFKPESYFYPRMLSNVWCLGLKEHPSKGIVLGATFFTHRNVIFDLDNYKIGFVEAKCPTHHRVVEERGRPMTRWRTPPPFTAQDVAFYKAEFTPLLVDDSSLRVIGTICVCISLSVTGVIGATLLRKT